MHNPVGIVNPALSRCEIGLLGKLGKENAAKTSGFRNCVAAGTGDALRLSRRRNGAKRENA